MLGLTSKYDEFRELTDGKVQKASPLNLVKISANPKEIKKLDSIKNEGVKNLDKVLKNVKVDSLERKKLNEILKNQNIDSLKKNSDMNVDFGSGTLKIKKMANYQKKFPNIPIDDALDSLKYKKTFGNRFAYRKAGVLNSFRTDFKTAFQDFGQELISYASISIFIFLPIFTLFLNFLFIRRNYTYVEHLIFVFHTQTVFFILLTIFVILNFFYPSEDIGKIAIILFAIYLFIAMKRFYKQGIIKTFIKFILLNQAYFFLASIGLGIVSLIAFAFY